MPEGMLDIRRMKEAGMYGQFFAIFFPPQNREWMPEDEVYYQSLKNLFYESLDRHKDCIAFAGCAADAERNFREGKLSAFLTIEDGRHVQGELSNIERFYQDGVRLISLTWNYENCFGAPNSKDRTIMERGLTSFGCEAVRYMNELGMLIDVSHLSDGGFYDAVRLSRKPLVASHSNARALCPHPRNLTDDMIYNLAEIGGVAGVNFYGAFLQQDAKREESTIAGLVAHIKHMTKLGGEDFVALGTDFDGIGGVLEIGTPLEMVRLFEQLEREGFSERQIEKLAYKNVLLSVDQRQDILSNLDTVLITLKSIIQIAVLAAVQNYALYIIWNLFYSVAYNLAVACITKKKYPEYICRGKLSGNELRAIFIQIKGLAVGKISQVSRTSFDNIILSAFCGLTDVAVYGNYYYILSAVLGFLTIIIQAMTASVGNSVATESKDKNYADFMRFNFYFNWLGSWCAICLLCLYQPFMRLWAGEKLTAPFYSAVLFSIFFYISQTGQIRSVYTSASGIWWEFRYLAVGEMICNIVLNFGLGYIFGMNGIVTATILTVTLFSIIGVGKKTINIYFKRGCAPYFRAMGAYALVTAAAGFVTYKACAEIKADGVSAVILRMLACIILPNVILSAAAVSNKKTRSYLKQIRSILFVEQ